MPEETDPLPDLIKRFRALKTHDEKCAFFNNPSHYPHLARIYNAVHFPAPSVKPE